MKLSEKKCEPCKGAVPAMAEAELSRYAREIPDWEIVEGSRLVRRFKFSNFAKPMKLANEIAELAESEHHHPDLHIGWGKLTIELWTHASGGLTQNDFILAAKIDEIVSA